MINVATFAIGIEEDVILDNKKEIFNNSFF